MKPSTAASRMGTLPGIVAQGKCEIKSRGIGLHNAGHEEAPVL